MDDLTALQELRKIILQSAIDRTGAFASAEYKQDRFFIRQAENFQGFLLIPFLKIRPGRISGDLDPAGIRKILFGITPLLIFSMLWKTWRILLLPCAFSPRISSIPLPKCF